MTTEEHFNFWKESAERDLEVAQTLFESEKFDWCLFIAHLVLEKALKAIFVKSNMNQIPPRLHNLNRLAELAGVKLSKEQEIFYNQVTDFNLETRYPKYKNEFYKHCTYDFTKEIFEKVKKEFLWLKSL